MERDGEPECAVIPIEEYRSMVAALEVAADLAAIERAWGDDAAGEAVIRPAARTPPRPRSAFRQDP